MSRNARDTQMECKVYVGDLPKEAEEKEIERAFTYYGRLKSVWVARNPAGFAFVEFEDPRDAEDAVRGLDGTNVCGARVRVEHATGKVRPKPWQRRGGGGGGGGDRGGGDRGGGDRGGGDRGGPPPRNARRSSEERCYQCGERGHLSRECPRDRRGGGGGGGGRQSSSRRSYSKSRSRSPAERKKSYSKSPSRSRSRDRTQSFR